MKTMMRIAALPARIAARSARIAALSAMLAFAVVNTAAAKDLLAILPFTGGQREDGETMAEIFSFQKDLTAVFSPVPRTSINRAIQGERGFQMASGMTDPDTIAALGKQLGAKYVVAGAITKLGSQNLLVISILHTEDLRQIAGDIQTYTSIEEIDGKLPAMAKTIVAALKTNASNLPLLALPPVQWSGGANSREADTLAQILAVHLVRSGKYAVYPRTKSLDQVQAEYGNQFNGDTADEYLPVVGRGTNPRLVLSVTARRLGSLNKFNAAIINLETGIQQAGESVDYRSLEDGVRVMEELALKLTGQEHILAQREKERRDAEAAARAAKAEEERRIAAAARAEEERRIAAAAAARAEEERRAAAARAARAEEERRIASTAVNAEEERRIASAAAQNKLVVGTPSAFAQAIAAINNDKTYRTYTIILNGNVASDPVAFTANTGKTISLKGDGTTRAITGSGGGRLFTVPESITLILESGITLNGSGKAFYVIEVLGGGTLIMKSGSTVRNANASGVNVKKGGTFTMAGGKISENGSSGVYVEQDGTFTMQGGEIRGNNGSGVYISRSGRFTMTSGEINGNNSGGVYVGGTFTMTSGEIRGNIAGGRNSSIPGRHGGGVYVYWSGTFTMTGGEIRGNTASDRGGGVFVDKEGTFIKRGGGTIDATNSAKRGKVAYVVKGSKERDATAGALVNLDSAKSGFADGWK